MVEAVAGGRPPAAPSRSTGELLPAVNAVMTRTQGAIMVKAALRAAGRARVAPPSACPLVEATADQVALVRDGLRQSGLT